jgi:ketopantoate hydroxymethyltransferase
MAKVFDKVAVDVQLVGEPLLQLILGLDTTVPTTLNVVIHYTRARPAMRNAVRLFQKGGTSAVKID